VKCRVGNSEIISRDAPMPLDAYSPCPCGSGKKLKFCCHAIAGEMEKVERYQQGRQPRLALLALDAIDRKHPHNPWAVTTRAEILLQEGEADEATEALEPLIREHPDHKYALGLMALASFSADGYELAKPAIHRAFQRCSRDFPTLTANLAMAIAGSMLSTGRYLSARAHLALALRVAPDDHKADVFRRLMDLDGNRRIPFPLRGMHELAEFPPPDGKQDDVRKAFVLSLLGCWRPAAKVLLKLAEERPQAATPDGCVAADPSSDAVLWFDIGLCRAWDGDEKLAAEALHKAASLQSDRETAVEWETLAQLLDNNVSEDRVQLLSRRFDVTSTSRLIGALDENAGFKRIDIPVDEEGPAALFHVVDRPELLEQPPDSLTPATVPNLVAQITILDEDEVESQRAYVVGQEGQAFETAVQQFAETAGDLVVPAEPETDDEDSTPLLPRELSALLWRWQLPEKTPLGVGRRLETEKFRQVTMQVWPDSPLSALAGKTPRQAAADPHLAVPLRGAINVLDSYCDRNRYTLPVDELLRELGAEPPAPAHFDGEAALTSLQLKRVDGKDVDDEQLGLLLQRAALIGHAGMLVKVLREVLGRPSCLKRFNEEHLISAIADLCKEQRRRDEALQWIARGREIAATGENSFQRTLNWVVHELAVRLDDPGDPELLPLLEHIGDYYLPKIPELQDEIEPLLDACGIAPPWAGEREPVAVGGSAGETIWTPERDAPTATSAGKKLWWPGQ
jgi:tetratricopeptide (TPR) repeat protein